MRMLNVLACIYDFGLLRSLMKQARDYRLVKLVALSTLPKDINIVNTLKIDVCLLECGEDQAELHDFVSALCRQEQRPHIVYLIDDHDLRFNEKDMPHLSHCSHLYAPFDAEYILRELIRLKEESDIEEKQDKMISDTLEKMGIPSHLSGYRYLKTSILLLLRNDPASMKRLYKETARIHKTTVSRVEKAIRVAVQRAYLFDPLHVAVNDKRPTNSQLIHSLYEQLHAKLNEEERELVL